MGCAYLAAMILNCNKKMLCCAALQRGCASILTSYVWEKSFKTLPKQPRELGLMAQTGCNTETKIRKEKSDKAFKYPPTFYPMQSFFKGLKAAQEGYAGKIQF